MRELDGDKSVGVCARGKGEKRECVMEKRERKRAVSVLRRNKNKNESESVCLCVSAKD